MLRNCYLERPYGNIYGKVGNIADPGPRNPGRRYTAEEIMDRIESMLGLATRAGKTVSGLYLVKEAVCGGKARLVIIAEDAEANTRKTLENKCASHQVPIRVHGSKESIGAATGKEYRSCAAVTDSGFAQSILKLADP